MGETEKKGVTVNVAEEAISSSQSDERERKEKLSDRRPTRHIPKVVANVKFQRLTKWWLKPSIIFA